MECPTKLPFHRCPAYTFVNLVQFKKHEATQQQWSTNIVRPDRILTFSLNVLISYFLKWDRIDSASISVTLIEQIGYSLSTRPEPATKCSERVIKKCWETSLSTLIEQQLTNFVLSSSAEAGKWSYHSLCVSSNNIWLIGSHCCRIEMPN